MTKMDRKLLSFWVVITLAQVSHSEQWILEAEEYTMAEVNVTYRDAETRETYTESAEMAKFGTGRIGSTSGILVHVKSGNGSSHNGCDPRYENEIPAVPWIALVRRGRCNFDDKLEAAYLNNASGLIVYNNKEDGLQKMTLRNKYRDQMVAVFISRAKGEELASLTDKLTRVHVHIDVGTHYSYRLTNINKTSVMFVSISFIVLMLISLAWLVYYYIQRFRQLHRKDRLSKQLTIAAKKAVARIPTRSVKSTDKEVTDAECCPICIEPYKSAEIVRVLPCRHQFHKACIDPWLLQHRTCPLCKMDILKHYGCSLGSQDSIVNVDMSSPIIGAAETTHRVRILSRAETASRLPVASATRGSSEEENNRQTVDVHH